MAVFPRPLEIQATVPAEGAAKGADAAEEKPEYPPG